jgi:CRP-like cAMP-binding protein
MTTSVLKSIHNSFRKRSHLPIAPKTIWQIESGVVRSLTWFEDGNCATLGLWSAGDIVGSALTSSIPFQIECLTDVTARVVPKENWYQLTDSMILHMQRSDEFLKILHCRQTELAVMHILNWLAKRFGYEVENGCLIDLRLTHQELSEIIGTTRVTITRILKSFERQGLIQPQQHHFILTTERDSFWHYEI